MLILYVARTVLAGVRGGWIFYFCTCRWHTVDTVVAFRIRNLHEFMHLSTLLHLAVVGNSPKHAFPRYHLPSIRDRRVKAPKPAKPDGRGTASRRRAAMVPQTAVPIQDE